MLLVLTDEQKEHLSLLKDVGDGVAVEFCRIAVEFLKGGINTKKYHTAASKLDVDVQLIRNNVEAIMYVLSQVLTIYCTDKKYQTSYSH